MGHGGGTFLHHPYQKNRHNSQVLVEHIEEWQTLKSRLNEEL